MLDAIQRNRHANLRVILRECTFDGICRRPGIALALHTDCATVARLLAGAPISETYARELEWLMHKPAGWMDEDVRYRDL